MPVDACRAGRDLSQWDCDDKRRHRSSGSIIFAGLQKSVSKDMIPLFSFDGGIIFRPSHTKVNCLYGIDAGTDYGDSTTSASGRLVAFLPSRAAKRLRY